MQTDAFCDMWQEKGQLLLLSNQEQEPGTGAGGAGEEDEGVGGEGVNIEGAGKRKVSNKEVGKEEGREWKKCGSRGKKKKVKGNHHASKHLMIFEEGAAWNLWISK